MQHTTKLSTKRGIFESSSLTSREEKVLDYLVHRLKAGAHLHDVVQESYVKRTCSKNEVDEIITSPELIHAAREYMENTFSSGELSPGR